MRLIFSRILWRARTDRDLQQMAKAAGIKANGSKAKLIEALQCQESGKENAPEKTPQRRKAEGLRLSLAD